MFRRVPSEAVHPASAADGPSRRVELETDDGVTLVGDLSLPHHPRAGAIICHPHPQYGGTRFDAVVTALFERLPTVGVAALRFDFRRDFGGGVDERRDASAAADELAAAVDDVPLVAVGYSFGAMVVLGLDHPSIGPKLAVAPPLGAMPMTGSPAGAGPILVLTPEHDQFCPPPVARPIVAGWPAADIEVVEGTDHFLAGRRQVVADRACEWISGVTR